MLTPVLYDYLHDWNRMRHRTSLVTLWHLIIIPKTFFQIYIWFNKEISNSISPASDPRLQRLHLRLNRFPPRFNRFQIWLHLLQFGQPDFRPQYRNSDSTNSAPSSVNSKIFNEAVPAAIYDCSFKIASFLFVFDHYHFTLEG